MHDLLSRWDERVRHAAGDFVHLNVKHKMSLVMSRACIDEQQDDAKEAKEAKEAKQQGKESKAVVAAKTDSKDGKTAPAGLEADASADDDEEFGVSRSLQSETFVPARLLQGLLPAALLENFRFWRRDGQDWLRAFPLNLGDTLWNYQLHVQLVKQQSRPGSSRSSARAAEWSAVVRRVKGEHNGDPYDSMHTTSLFDLNKQLEPNKDLEGAMR